MPKVSDVYGASKWLKAPLLKDRGRVFVEVLIASAQIQECKLYKSNQTAPAIVLTLSFQEPYFWELNKGNAKKIGEFLGEDFAQWVGHKIGIMLLPDVMMGDGKVVDMLKAYDPANPPQQVQDARAQTAPA